MRLVIAAIGRLRSGPEAELTADYLARATAAGRGIGLGPADLRELEAKPSGDQAREAALLLAEGPAGSVRIAMDERGEALPSRELAQRLARWRDQGVPGAVFCLGGADGLDESVRRSAQAVLAFGPQTWPHRLARVMLAEQLYRAVTILCGSPYHRD